MNQIGPLTMSRDPRWEENQKVFAAASGSANELVPALAAVIRTGAWREFLHPVQGLKQFARFADYCREFVRIEAEAVEALLGRSNFDKAADEVRRMLREDIAPVAAVGTNQHSAGVDNVNSNGGNDQTYLVARLKRDDPDLAQEVVEGRMSAHAAAVKAGIKKPTATIPVDTADNAVRALLRRFSAAAIIDAATRLDLEVTR